MHRMQSTQQTKTGIVVGERMNIQNSKEKKNAVKFKTCALKLKKKKKKC